MSNMDNRIKVFSNDYAFEKAKKDGKLTSLKSNSESFYDGFKAGIEQIMNNKYTKEDLEKAIFEVYIKNDIEFDNYEEDCKSILKSIDDEN